MDIILKILKSRGWVKRKEIIRIARLNGRKLNEREVRKYIEKYNEHYMNCDKKTLIAHSNKGYKLTSDKDEINASAEALKKQGVNLLVKYSKTIKALGLQDNLRLDLEEKEVI